jgi:hypothetical protein
MRAFGVLATYARGKAVLEISARAFGTVAQADAASMARSHSHRTEPGRNEFSRDVLRTPIATMGATCSSRTDLRRRGLEVAPLYKSCNCFRKSLAHVRGPEREGVSVVVEG